MSFTPDEVVHGFENNHGICRTYRHIGDLIIATSNTSTSITLFITFNLLCLRSRESRQPLVNRLIGFCEPPDARIVKQTANEKQGIKSEYHFRNFRKILDAHYVWVLGKTHVIIMFIIEVLE